METTQFKAAVPIIGLNRTFIRDNGLNILETANDDCIDINNNGIQDKDRIDSIALENILIQNMANLSKYKNGEAELIYDEKVKEQKNEKINFEQLLNLLMIDETGFDSFLGTTKGEFVENFPNKEIDNEVEFESRFESGNLRLAIKLSENEYDLILKHDINTNKASNWFFFKIKVKKLENQTKKHLKFNIINCLKNETLYNKGLKVLMYDQNKKQWTRNTDNIFYYINGLTIADKKFYSLTYSIDINFEENTEYLEFYFAYCYPYTYTNLQNYLEKILNAKENNKILKHEVIGKTLSGNNLDQIVITDFTSNFDVLAYRPAVILTSRVHPGESNASYVIQGVIALLLSDNKESIALRNKFIFKIIPMLNPDGVINGNYRTSLIGKDLNRLWNDPREEICPTIKAAKELIKKSIESRDVFMYCDFHGHSNKPNYFLYGCPSEKQMKLNCKEMVLGRLMQIKNTYIDPDSCLYKISPGKVKTARAVVHNELNVEMSYCLESSIGYITLGQYKNQHFTPELYKNIGRDFCLSLLDLTNKNLFVDLLLKIQIEENLKQLSLNSSPNDSIKKQTEHKKEKIKDKTKKKKTKTKKASKSSIKIKEVIEINIIEKRVMSQEKAKNINIIKK